ncbi:hypothetical protein Q31b_36410 [Novipirellula aureliae]|uniref:DUF1559 domain-containing protein n=1 Tax=Novipirellula aureliae TaxID=2527966 RepID=A0A5C6DSH1_9BACT|nr:DUF1559 domain-containing protein [Novipirellula aureliae]TWU40293.1 hypothetical protein Q31b_36410 [Novipirellula aureliae]
MSNINSASKRRPNSNPNSTRLAFTLVELLVVIAIIGVLVGLLLPAVQAARDSARRMSCSNQMHQMGLGISNYHSAFNELPLAWWFETPPDAFNGKPWSVALLPFIEQQSLYERYDHSTLAMDQTSADNVELIGHTIATYQCPSSPGAPESRRYMFDARPIGLPFTATSIAASDYCPTTGVKGVYATYAYGPIMHNDRTGAMQVKSEMFGGNQKGTFAGILDGLSHTLLIGERTGGPDVYNAGRLDPVATTFLRGTEGGGWGDPINGEHWLQGSLRTGATWPPQGGPCAINCTNARGFGFHSFHAGGSHFLFADGAVRFFTPSVSPIVLAALITRRGREVIEEH